MKQSLFLFFSALLLVSLLLAGQGARPVSAASYTVNSLADNTDNDDNCTLREAILAPIIVLPTPTVEKETATTMPLISM